MKIGKIVKIKNFLKILSQHYNKIKRKKKKKILLKKILNKKLL